MLNPDSYNISGYGSYSLVRKMKNILGFICDEFIHGGHLISLGTAGIALSFMLIYETVIRWEFLLIIYIGTLCIYNYDYHKGFTEDSLHNIDRTNYLKITRRYRIFILFAYSFGFFSLLIYFGNAFSIVFGSLLLLSAILYTYKIKKLTANIVGLKSYYTALSFALSTIFAALYCQYQIKPEIFIFFSFVFLQILLITSFCDLKDIDTDKKYGLITLPIYFGKNKFLIFLHILNILSFAIIVMGVVFGVIPWFSFFLSLSCLYCFYFIQKSKKPDINLNILTNVVVDATYFLWSFFLILGKTIITMI